MANRPNVLEILEMPLIESPIIEAAEKGNLVLFIGAGVSMVMGGPSWHDLALKHLEYVYRNCDLTFAEYQHLKRQEPRKLLSICSRMIADQKKDFDFKKVLEDDVKDKVNEKYREYSDIYKYLFDFNCPFITTNYDGFLDEIQNLHNRSVISKKEISSKKKKLIYHYSDLPDANFLNGGDVLHIHGSIHDEKRRLVLSISDYFKAYQKDTSKRGKKTYLPDFLDEIFNKKVVLFVGYGLEEYEVIEYMVNNSLRKREPRHFMLYPFLKEEGNILHLQESYYKQLGINIIPYSISKIGYSQLYNVIKEWSKVLNGTFKDKTYIDNIAEIDSIL